MNQWWLALPCLALSHQLLYHFESPHVFFHRYILCHLSPSCLFAGCFFVHPQHPPYVPCNKVIFKGICGIMFAGLPIRVPFIPLLSSPPTCLLLNTPNRPTSATPLQNNDVFQVINVTSGLWANNSVIALQYLSPLQKSSFPYISTYFSL